ncbi:hypothetical protein A9Q87_05855 [Flavobacteriales bacterium 34_180_T64]|nr:hypothetical protein A9Q87_05855 [Flavobacteriales bacterium 34_180_T64]
MKLITLILTVFFLKSCGNTKEIASTQNNKSIQNMEVVSGAYEIAKIGADDIFPVELSLEFDSKTNKVSGFSGCNNFTGTYSIDGSHISVSQLITTQAFCKPKINQFERKFLEYLTNASSYKIVNDELILIRDNKDTLHANKRKSKTVFTYQQTTRGFFEKIWVTKDSITISNDRDLIDTKAAVCNEEDWELLMSLYKNIDVNTISELEPPSKTFQFDAAAMATVEIDIDSDNYKTKIFDHGRPPKSIEELVNKLLSMKKMMLKE